MTPDGHESSKSSLNLKQEFRTLALASRDRQQNREDLSRQISECSCELARVRSSNATVHLHWRTF